MAKRVGVLLSGCGFRDGSEIGETVLTLAAIERAGGRAVAMAPDLPLRAVDHLDPQRTEAQPPRNALAEAARIVRGDIRDLASVKVEDLDALIVPGGHGVTTLLSNYEDKGALCEVNADVARLLKGCLAARKPMGFLCIAPILAARVLGPVAGVRITFGPRGIGPDKHAAVMGADVRHCPARELVIDEKARVISTPGYMYDDARLLDVIIG